MTDTLDTIDGQQKIVEMYYNDKAENYETGLVLVLEDWTILNHYSTDVIKPFNQPTDTKQPEQE